MLSVLPDEHLLDAAVPVSPLRKRPALLERSANTPELRGGFGVLKPSPAKLPFGKSPLRPVSVRSETHQEQENTLSTLPELHTEEPPDSWDDAYSQRGSPLLMTLSPSSTGTGELLGTRLNFAEQPGAAWQNDQAAAEQRASVNDSPPKPEGLQSPMESVVGVEPAAHVAIPAADDAVPTAAEIGGAEVELQANIVREGLLALSVEEYTSNGRWGESSIDHEGAVLQELLSKLVNAQEDAIAWQAEHDRILVEGRGLYVSYATKCERVKLLRAELEQTCAIHGVERERLEAEVTALRAALERHSHKAKSAEALLSESVNRTMQAADGLSAEGLSQKLEAAVISNELLRAEVSRQSAAAKRDASAAEVQVARLKQHHADQITSHEEMETSLRAQIDAGRADSMQLREQLAQQQSHIQTLLQEADAARAEAEALVGCRTAADEHRQARELAEKQRDAALQETAAAATKHESLAAQVVKVEADLRLLYRQHRDESQAAAQRYEGAAARCTILSARCAKQQNVIQEMRQWYAECAELSQLLEQNQSTIQSLSVDVVQMQYGTAGASPEAEPSQEQCDAVLQSLRLVEIERGHLREEVKLHALERAKWRAAQTEMEADAAILSVLNGVIGQIELEVAVASAKAEAETNAETRQHVEAAHHLPEQEQVARLKAELHRMSVYARELAEFQDVEGEASILTRHEHERLLRQVASGEEELEQLQKMVAQLALSMAEMVQQIQAQQLEREAAGAQALRDVASSVAIAKAAGEREASLREEVYCLKESLAAQASAAKEAEQAAIDEWSATANTLECKIFALQEVILAKHRQQVDLECVRDEAFLALESAKKAEEEARRAASEAESRAAQQHSSACKAEDAASESRKAEKLAQDEAAASQEKARVANRRCSEAEHSLAVTNARLHGQADVETTLRAQLRQKGSELREALACLQHARNEFSQSTRQSTLAEVQLRQVYSAIFCGALRDADGLLAQAESDAVDSYSTVCQLRAQLERALRSSVHRSSATISPPPEPVPSDGIGSPVKRLAQQLPPRPSPPPEESDFMDRNYFRMSLGGGRLPSSRVSMGSALQRPPGWPAAAGNGFGPDEPTRSQVDALAETKRRLAERRGRQSDAGSYAPVSLERRTRSQSAGASTLSNRHNVL